MTFLVFFRFVDKPSVASGGRILVDYSLSWGIFFGLLAALGLLASGLRLRAAHLAEPGLPPEHPHPPRPERAEAATVVKPRGPRAEAPTTVDAPQLPFD